MSDDIQQKWGETRDSDGVGTKKSRKKDMVVMVYSGEVVQGMDGL